MFTARLKTPGLRVTESTIHTIIDITVHIIGISGVIVTVHTFTILTFTDLRIPMDPNYKFPASSGAPLNQVSPDRVNQQRYDIDTSARVRLFDQEQSHSRDSSVHEKAAKFDTLAFQGKALERRTNDAALKRAMLGREEAESEMRRYRDEARLLRKEVQEGKDRERKVGVRLENVMVSFNATNLNMMLIV